MKFNLRAGAEVDVLTQQELADQIGILLGELRDLQAVEPRWIRADAAGVADATGAATIPVYRVRQGQEFRLQRVVVTVDGNDAGTPSAGGGVQVLRDELVVDVDTGGKLPAVIVSPAGAAARFRNGATVNVQVLKGPANANVTVYVEGTLHQGAP